jgi:hypothetical protein
MNFLLAAHHQRVDSAMLILKIEMIERTHADDFKDVMRAAEEALTAALKDGQSRYAAGAWLMHSMEHHLDHAGAHLEDLLNT